MSRGLKSPLVRILVGTYLELEAIRGCVDSQIAQRKANLPLFEIALVVVRLDRVASGIVNADHGVM